MTSESFYKNLTTLTYKVLFFKDHFFNDIIKKFSFKVHVVDVVPIIIAGGGLHYPLYPSSSSSVGTGIVVFSSNGIHWMVSAYLNVKSTNTTLN